MQSKIVSLTFFLIVWGTGHALAQDIQPIAILEGHVGSVNSAAYSPDGRTLVSGSADRSVKLWDVQSRTLKATLLGHTDEVTSVAYSPDGRTLASGSLDKTIKLWDVQSRTLKTTLEGHTDGIASIVYSPDGSILASASWDKTIKLWEAQSRTLKATLDGHTRRVVSVAYSPDGSILASASWDSSIKLWEAQNGRQKANLRYVPEGQHSSFYSVAFSPDGRTLASGGVKFIQLWDVQTGTLKTKLYTWPGVYGEDSLVYSSDGSMLASAGRSSPTTNFRVWDVRDISNIPCVPLQCGKLIAILEGRPASLAFSPDGSILASGGGLWEATIKFWRLREPTAVGVSPQGKISTTWGKIKLERQ